MTHSLIGVLAGESCARGIGALPTGLPASTRRNTLVWLVGIGSNLPDADFVYPAFSGDKLDYLLQHRGYTHTIAGALLLGALLLGATEVVLRWRGLAPRGADRALFGAGVVGALLLHLAMDYTNSYGVHPFWPIDERWRYGDSVFIVEPLLWAAAAPLAFTLRTRTARLAVGLALLTAIALSLVSGLVPRPFAFVLIALIATMLLLSRLLSPGVALTAGIALWLAVTGIVVAAGHVAAERARGIARERFAQAPLMDVVLTPLPVDPVCWEALLLQREAARYVARRAMLSLAPEWLPAARCPARWLQNPSTAPLAPVPAPTERGVAWYGEFSMPLDALAAVDAGNCRAAAFLRFARAPFLANVRGAPVVGDLRFDRGPRLSFAELDLAARRPCPRHLPPWEPPRQDLLRPVSGAVAARGAAVAFGAVR